MRFTPWQIFIINDSNRPLPDFLNKTDRGLLTSIAFCPGDKIYPNNNFFWNIDIAHIQSVIPGIEGKIINICWEYNDEKPKLLEACNALYNCRTKMLRLTISECNCELFVVHYVDVIKDLLEIFDEIVLLNEKGNERIFPFSLEATHIRRRRPCKYPFTCITAGRSGKLYPCPYVCAKDFGKVTGLTQVLENNNYLLFLSAHLCGFLEDYPFCKKCQYWLDGWLGEEKEYLQDKEGNRFELLWEGHSCTIKRNKKK